MSGLFWVSIRRRGIDHHIVTGNRTLCGRTIGRHGEWLAADLVTELRSGLCALCAAAKEAINVT